jgi:hypothetical protein
MKRGRPFFLLIIPAGVLVIVFALILAVNLDQVVSFLGTSFLGTKMGSVEILFYTAIVLILVIAGALMGLAAALIAKKNDREEERLWQEAGRAVPSTYREITGYFDSIETSITRLGDISEQMKDQSEKIIEFHRYFAGEPKTARVKTEGPAIYSITSGDNKVTNLRIIHPAEELIPSEPFPLPQSHQRIWFFPSK